MPKVAATASSPPSGDLPFKQAKDAAIAAFERSYLEPLLERADGNFSKAARAAKMDRMYLHQLAQKHGLGAKKPPYLDLLPLIERAVRAFGPERCMWESDAPLQARAPQSYQASVDLIREHARFLSPAEREQILFRTADEFFFRRRRT